MPGCEDRSTSAGAVSVLPIPFGVVRQHPELLEEYGAECGIPGLGRPDPQWGTYAWLAASGQFFALGVYSESNLIGFVTVLTSILPHYGVRVATVESLFVAKTWRRGGAGSKLIASAKAEARARGCVAMMYIAPAGGQLEAVLGKRSARTNSVFCESLSGCAAGELA